MMCYLINDYRGACSKMLYAPAGTQVYILQRVDNMVRVIDNKGESFWINESNLTPSNNVTTLHSRATSKKKL